MLIGVTGTDGAGKGTVVDYLVREKGFTHCHARTIFLEEIRKKNLPEDRNHMRIVANDLRKKYGNAFVVEYFIKKLKDEKLKNIIIDSIRTTAEAETLKKNDGILVAIDASQKVRYMRVQERGSESDQVTFEEFVKHENLEMNDPDPYGMQKRKVIEMADYMFVNDGTIEELEVLIEKSLTKVS